MSNDSRNGGTSIGDALMFAVVMMALLVFLLLAALSIFLFGPGMAVVGLVRLGGTALDTSQMWTFAIVTSLAILGGLTLMTGSVRAGAKVYSGVSLALIGLLLFLRLGFKASGPETILSYYFPEDAKTQAAEVTGASGTAVRSASSP